MRVRALRGAAVGSLAVAGVSHAAAEPSCRGQCGQCYCASRRVRPPSLWGQGAWPRAQALKEEHARLRQELRGRDDMLALLQVGPWGRRRG